MEKKLRDLMNQQINNEFASAYLYLEFANKFRENDLNGFAHWYELQAGEELEHAMKFFNFMHDSDESVVLTDIAKPVVKSAGSIDILRQGLAAEQSVTADIHKLCEAAADARDLRTRNFLEWFISEQSEEERSAKTLIKKTEHFGTGTCGMYALDREFGAREA